MKDIYISEIFGPTIQGEGQLIGKPTVFVRVGGCDYRCSWCDSQYAVKSQYRETWSQMSQPAIFEEIKKLTDGQPILVTLSGGNPAIYDFDELIRIGNAEGFTFAMETQGSIVKPYFKQLDYLTVSPKPPSAHVIPDPIQLRDTLAAHHSPHLKIVIANEADYRFAKRIHAKYPDIPMTLQPCNLNHTPDSTANLEALDNQLKWLIERTQQDHWYQVTLLPQLHVMLWNNERGV